MKKIIFSYVAVIALLMTACQGNENKTGNNETATETCQKDSCKMNKYTPKTILELADSLVDKEICIEGQIAHVCHCSGKKLVLMDENDSTASIKVMAGGAIEKFDTCLVGKKTSLKGILKVNKLTKAEAEEALSKIAETEKMEKEIQEKSSEKESHGHCGGGKKESFEKKIQWMNDNQKDFYPTYYIEIIKFADGMNCCAVQQAKDSTAKSCCSNKQE